MYPFNGLVVAGHVFSTVSLYSHSRRSLEGRSGESNLITLPRRIPMAEGEDIIIKGGSVEVKFDNTLYPRNPNDPKKHENANRKISKIVIVDEDGNEKYNSGESQNGMKWTVTVSTK
jgi:hypothetical protein